MSFNKAQLLKQMFVNHAGTTLR